LIVIDHEFAMVTLLFRAIASCRKWAFQIHTRHIRGSSHG